MAVSDRAPQTLELADGVRVGRTMPRWLVLLSRRKITLIGAVIMIAIGALALLAPFVAGHPARQDNAPRPIRPSPGHWVGTHGGGPDPLGPGGYGARPVPPVGRAVRAASF